MIRNHDLREVDATETESLQSAMLIKNNPDDATPSEGVLTLATSSFPKQLLVPNRLCHQTAAGLNPIVDAASYVFTVLNKLKTLKVSPNQQQLHQELIAEVNLFHETIQQLAYAKDYVIVCRYVLCATIDETISHTSWGQNWTPLLQTFKLDQDHHNKFFAILERSIKNPESYIELMELMYLCLNTGYRGQYRGSDYNHYQLDSITNNLYQHIRAYRGSFSKTLSSSTLKPLKHTAVISSNKYPLTLIFILTACVIMTIFISLGYLMDVISNEAYKNISEIKLPATSGSSQK